MLAKAVDQQLDRIQIQGKKGSHEFLIVPLVGRNYRQLAAGPSVAVKGKQCQWNR